MKFKGIDVFDPRTLQIGSAGPDNVACWMTDTDYNEEALFVRHAHFLARTTLQITQDDAKSRNRRRSLGDIEQRHLAPLPQARVGQDRGKGNQPPWG
jgi:hypothetical protein